MLSKYIHILLNQNGRVIIPDFGALIFKGDESQTIYFNEYLRFNDGLLIAYLIDEEKMEKSQASKLVKEFVDLIQEKLTTEKSAIIEGLGTLYYDADNKIQFRTSKNVILVTPSITEIPASTPIVVPPVVPSQPLMKEMKETEEPIIAKKLLEESPILIQEEKSKPKVQPVLTKPKQIEVKVQKSFKKENNSSNKLKWASIYISIIALTAAGLAIIFIYSGKSPKYPTSKPIKISEKEINQPEDKNINKVNEPQIEKEKITSTTKNSQPTVNLDAKVSGTVQYYLVAGCFSVERNADRMVEKLAGNGYSAQKLKKTQNLFVVTFSSYSIKSEALIELKSLREKGFADVWLLRR